MKSDTRQQRAATRPAGTSACGTTLAGTPERPRLAVFRSLNHIYAQVIDDAAGHTLVAASDLDADVRTGRDRQEEVGGRRRWSARRWRRRRRRRGSQSSCSTAAGFSYHGRVKALADAARKGGLTF